MPKVQAKNRLKVNFTCTAPEHLSTTSNRGNQEVYDACYQEPKFEPRVSCVGCTYLETKTRR